jgi:hypothetical protein
MQILAALLFGALASGAGAANWVPVTSLAQGTVLLNADSVEHEGANVRAWVEFKQAGATENGVAYELDHWMIDCKEMTVASLATMQYDTKGKVTAGTALSAYYPERTPIKPHSVGFEVYRLVCR